MLGNGNSGLVLSGGGARGAYQVGVLKALASYTSAGASVLPFTSVAGISAGALTASMLAQHADSFVAGVERLERIWTGMSSSDVFLMDYGALQAFISKTDKPMSLLDNRPLAQLLQSEFQPGAVRQAIDAGHIEGLAITASNYTSGEATTFFQAREGTLPWRHHRRRDSVQCDIDIEHLMASAALPILFPPQRIDNEFFVDGSLRMTEPLSPVINMGADKILVIGVRNETPTELPAEPVSPGVGEAAGFTLDSLFSENLNADIEQMQQINELVDLLPWWQRRKSKRRKIDVMVVRPSEDIQLIAARHATELPRAVRLFLRTVGGWGHEWRLPSFLLFEGGFAADLIDLGYRDGLRLRPAIEQFFNA